MYSYSRLFLLTLFSIFLFSSFALSQKRSDKDKYKSRSLGEIIALNRDGTDQILKTAKISDRHGFIGIDLFYSKVRLKYIGLPRPISKEHQGLVKNWEKLQKVDKKFIALYENEFLFKEGDAEYWIPVQKALGEHLVENLKSNDLINLFVVYVGAFKAQDVKDFSSLFLITGYEQ